jgi:prepilin-type processing-associated H-X9-DG protein
MCFSKRASIDNGAFNIYSAVPSAPQDFTDGMTATAAMTEWVAGPRAPGRTDAMGSVFSVPGQLNGPDNLTNFINACHNLNVINAAVNANDKGSAWIGGGYRFSLYNHNMNIDDHSCVNQGTVIEGAYTASSRHSRGINVLFAEGHVRYLGDTIAPGVWQSLGTRNGGELVSDY